MLGRTSRRAPLAPRPGRAPARLEPLEGRTLFAGGALDTTSGWGDGGHAVTDFGTAALGTDDVPLAVAVQANGRIVTVGGTASVNAPTASQFAVARHFANGTLDERFETADFAVGPAVAMAVAIDASQRIIVAGQVGSGLGVARYEPNGDLDTSFGGDGTVLLDALAGSVRDISLVIDSGKRPVIGLTLNTAEDDWDLGVIRLYEENGAQDLEFGNFGIARTNAGGKDRAGGLAIDAAGRIVQAGVANFSDGFVGNFNGELVTTRLNANGSPDLGYGAAGVAHTSTSMHLVNSVIVDGNGSLVLAGAISAINPEQTDRFKYLTLARVATNGAPVTINQTELHSHFPTWSLGVQTDGKILVAGNNLLDGPDQTNYVLARFNPNLTLDTDPINGFGDGNDGIQLSASDSLQGTAVVVDAEGQILVAGFDGLAPNGSDFLLARHYSGVADEPAPSVIADAHTGLSNNAYSGSEGANLTLAGGGTLVGGGSGPTFNQSQRRVIPATTGGPVNGALTYEWDIDYDATNPNEVFHPDISGQTPNVSGVDGPDTFTIALRVSDGAGHSDINTAVVTINNVAPTAGITGPTTVTEAEGGSFTLTSTVSDPGVTDTFTYAWSATRLNADGTTTAYAGPANGTSIALDALDDGTWNVTLTVRDDDGGQHTVTHVTTVANVAPTASIVNAAAIVNEGTAVELRAVAQDVPADTFSYAWAVTKDGEDYASHSGEGALGSAFTFTPDDNAVYLVNLTVTDDDGDSSAPAQSQVTANNVAPTPDVSGDVTGVRFQERTLRLAALDPSTADVAAGFTYTVDWGDGSPVDTYLPGDLTATHVYTENATYTINVTATDQDNGTSAPMPRSMVVQTAAVQDGVLSVSGGAGADKIRVFPALGGGIAVGVSDAGNGAAEFVQVYTQAITRVAVFGQGGADSLVAELLGVPVEMYGGAGDDKLIGGSAGDILVGGDGADRLAGNGGRDFLIGGRGIDKISGDAEDDILIGGFTKFDADVLSLRRISDEWRRTTPTLGGIDATYASRVAHITGTLGGLNLDTFLVPDVNVWDDGVIDTLAGVTGQDLFFANVDESPKDKVADATSVEFLFDLDPVL